MNLNQITLPAVDVAAAAGFYQRLGLRLIVDALPRYVRFECPEGGARSRSSMCPSAAQDLALSCTSSAGVSMKP